MGKKRQSKPNTWNPNYNKDNKSNKKSKIDNNNDNDETNIINNIQDGDVMDIQSGASAHNSKINSKNYFPGIVPRNEHLEHYYKTIGICENEEEWQKFMDCMAKPLPTTFRINTTIGKSLQSLVIDQLKEIVNDSTVDPELGGYKDIQIDGETVELPTPIKWYPNGMAWRSSIPKKSFKKNPALGKCHKFLVHHSHQGNITRQEAVSMIPPLFLEVQSHHNILDMCAAPGSKTTQILEDLHMKHNLENAEKAGNGEDPSIYTPKGCIIANDVDTNRCYMLVTQATRLGSPAIIVTNHEAQNFPLLYEKNATDNTESPIYMDRILCDVPCSGDGTTRKNPEVWKKWAYAGGIGLHQLQIKIATRGCQLLKVGGRMVYSTCSMNPVENEAVISEILQKSNGSIRLVDVSSQYPDLIRKPGLHSWPVIDRAGTFPTFESQPEDKKYKLSKTLWPPAPEDAAKMHLEYCMRVYPHHQDTGGFFIAVLEKVDDFPNQIGKKTGISLSTNIESTTTTTTTTKPTTTTTTESTATTTEEADKTTTTTTTTESTTTTEETKEIKKPKQQQQQGNQPKIKERDRRNKFFEEPFTVLNDEIKKELAAAVDFYGITNEFPINNLLTRGKKSQKIHWASDSVMAIISNESNKNLKTINCALKVLQRHDGLGSMGCPYRISQDSVLWLEPYISKRIVNMSHDELVLLINKVEPFFNDYSDQLSKQFKEMEPGCFIIRINGKLRETPSSGMVFSAWRGKVSLHLLVSKPEIKSLKNIFGLPDDEPTTTDSTTTTTETTTTDTTTTTTTTPSEPLVNESKEN